MDISKNNSIIYSLSEKKEYSLIKKSKIIEVILKKGDYLYIPKYWFHYVDTKEETIALNYSFKLKEVKNDKNKLLKNIINCYPYYSSHREENLDFKSYEDCMKKLYHDKKYSYPILFGKNRYLNIVKKPHQKNNNSQEYLNLEELINLKINTEICFYKCRSNESENEKLEILSTILNFNNIKNDAIIEDISNLNSLWVTFDKEINTGVHYDCCDNIILVLSGEKRILLSHPYNKKYLYITPLKNLEFNNSLSNLLYKNYLDNYFKDYEKLKKYLVLNFENNDIIDDFIIIFLDLLKKSINNKIKLLCLKNGNKIEEYIDIINEKMFIKNIILDNCINIKNLDEINNLEENKYYLISSKLFFDIKNNLLIDKNNLPIENILSIKK